jgi:hypothetical protein
MAGVNVTVVSGGQLIFSVWTLVEGMTPDIRLSISKSTGVEQTFATQVFPRRKKLFPNRL